MDYVTPGSHFLGGNQCIREATLAVNGTGGDRGCSSICKLGNRSTPASDNNPSPAPHFSLGLAPHLCDHSLRLGQHITMPSCRIWAQVPALLVSLGKGRALSMELSREEDGSKWPLRPRVKPKQGREAKRQTLHQAHRLAVYTEPRPR